LKIQQKKEDGLPTMNANASSFLNKLKYTKIAGYTLGDVAILHYRTKVFQDEVMKLSEKITVDYVGKKVYTNPDKNGRLEQVPEGYFFNGEKLISINEVMNQQATQSPMTQVKTGKKKKAN
jgi:hypothetical protein